LKTQIRKIKKTRRPVFSKSFHVINFLGWWRGLAAVDDRLAYTSLDSWITAWGSVSDLRACVGFRGSKKVEKHWCRP